MCSETSDIATISNLITTIKIRISIPCGLITKYCNFLSLLEFIWRCCGVKNGDVRIGQPGEEATEEDFVQQPPTLKSPDGDEDPNVYRANRRNSH
jgi:hypothetical protein